MNDEFSTMQFGPVPRCKNCTLVYAHSCGYCTNCALERLVKLEKAIQKMLDVAPMKAEPEEWRAIAYEALD